MSNPKHNGQPTPEQQARLAHIINPQQRAALLQAIAAGEEIPDFAWTPIPARVDCDQIYREVKKKVDERLGRSTAKKRDTDQAPRGRWAECRDLVYGHDYDHNNFEIMPRELAEELAATKKAYSTAKTWGEFLTQLPPAARDEVVARFQAEEIEVPGGSRPGQIPLTGRYVGRASKAGPAAPPGTGRARPGVPGRDRGGRGKAWR